MWLKRLVGLVMIITCVGMNALVVIGFLTPNKLKQLTLNSPVTQSPLKPAPSVTLTAQPGTFAAGSFSALTWSATNNPTSCTASGSWSGVKTPFGSESTGRISTPGQFKFSLSCKNSGGLSTATVSVLVGPANAPPPPARAGNNGATSTSTSTVSYCGGRIPCYNASDIAKHGSSGDCWGWLGDRVINISGFDAGFHVARSGVNSIQISGICGRDISAAVGGKVSTPDYPNGHVHQLGAVSNSDPNYLGFFVGYFDNTKP